MQHQSVFIGSDHGGLDLKAVIIGFLKSRGDDVRDMGPHKYDKDDDFPDYAEKVCMEVLASGGAGILICKSGNGMARVANKIPGIRAAVCWNEYSAIKEKEHGNTNVLCLSAAQTGADHAQRIVDAWLSTQFSGEERHKRRLDKVAGIERKGLGAPARKQSA